MASAVASFGMFGPGWQAFEFVHKKKLYFRAI